MKRIGTLLAAAATLLACGAARADEPPQAGTVGIEATGVLNDLDDEHVVRYRLRSGPRFRVILLADPGAQFYVVDPTGRRLCKGTQAFTFSPDEVTIGTCEFKAIKAGRYLVRVRHPGFPVADKARWRVRLVRTAAN